MKEETQTYWGPETETVLDEQLTTGALFTGSLVQLPMPLIKLTPAALEAHNEHRASRSVPDATGTSEVL